MAQGSTNNFLMMTTRKNVTIHQNSLTEKLDLDVSSALYLILYNLKLSVSEKKPTKMTHCNERTYELLLQGW